MRGIVLAGGTGSRLGKLTRVVNKHLLPVGEDPMIEWPIHVLKSNGIGDITIVSSPQGVGQLASYLGSGFDYRVQDKAGGIAQALYCAKRTTLEPVVVILGDNIFLSTPRIPNIDTGVYANYVFLKEVPAARLIEFGVPSFSDAGRIANIVEKPKVPLSKYAVTGLYVFGEDVFDKIEKLEESDRGEFEITDLLNLYATKGRLGYKIVDGFWGDAGTHAGLAGCSEAVKNWGKK